ncbi:MAG: ABC transporter substrate-binding protein [Armatimonadota bacterium]
MTPDRKMDDRRPLDPELAARIELSRREFLARSIAAGAGVGLTTGYLATFLRLFEPAKAFAGAAPIGVTAHCFASQPLPQVFLQVIDEYMKTRPNVKVTPWLSSASDTFLKVRAAYAADPNRPLTNMMHTNAAWNALGLLDDIWEPLNLDRIPNAKDLPKQYINKGNKGIAFASAPMALTYNTTHVKGRPTGWRDLWGNPAFKGKTTTLDYQWLMNGLIMAARINGGSEKNAEPGWKVLIEHADQWATIAASNAQEKDLLVNGTVHLYAHYAGNIYNWQREGGPFGIVIPVEGMPMTEVYLNIIKGTTPQQKEICEDIINMLLAPEWLAKWAEVVLYVPASEAALRLLPGALRNLGAYRRDNLRKAHFVDWTVIAENDAEWRKRWDKEVKSRIR